MVGDWIHAAWDEKVVSRGARVPRFRAAAAEVGVPRGDDIASTQLVSRKCSEIGSTKLILNLTLD